MAFEKASGHRLPLGEEHGRRHEATVSPLFDRR
jgi:hypothetical protein